MYKKNKPIFKRKSLPLTIGLLDETGIFSFDNSKLIVNRLTDNTFLKEMKSVANETLSKYNYCDEIVESGTGFNITLGGSLDILHPGVGTCASPDCRSNEAMNIARTAGLFADKLYITDHLTQYVSDVDLQDPYNLNGLLMMVAVIKTFSPLIDERIVDFRTPKMSYCKECFTKITSEIDLFLTSVIDTEANTKIYCVDNSGKSNKIIIDSPDVSRFCGTRFMINIDKSEKTGFHKLKVKDEVSFRLNDYPYVLDTINRSLKSSLLNVMSSVESAQRTSSLFMSKSELDTLFLSSVDRNIPNKNDINNWEAMRSIDLPWVGELDINQILMLRHQASESLESLRDNLSLGVLQGGDKRAVELVSELTAKVSELKQEIMTNDIVAKNNNRFEVGFGSLAISLVFYGLASNVPAAGVGSVAALLAAISHMRTSAKEQSEKKSKIITSPAYALLKAKELLSCKG